MTPTTSNIPTVCQPCAPCENNEAKYEERNRVLEINKNVITITETSHCRMTVIRTRSEGLDNPGGTNPKLPCNSPKLKTDTRLFELVLIN